VVEWVAPDKALTLIEEPELKALVAAFAKRLASLAFGDALRMLQQLNRRRDLPAVDHAMRQHNGHP
jgi:hypothetical protein